MWVTPPAAARASRWARNGAPAVGSRGFGADRVSGRSRVPRPPTSIMASSGLSGIGRLYGSGVCSGLLGAAPVAFKCAPAAAAQVSSCAACPPGHRGVCVHISSSSVIVSCTLVAVRLLTALGVRRLLARSRAAEPFRLRTMTLRARWQGATDGRAVHLTPGGHDLHPYAG